MRNEGRVVAALGRRAISVQFRRAQLLMPTFVLPMMLAVGVIFTALWVVCLWQGQRIDAIQAGRAA